MKSKIFLAGLTGLLLALSLRSDAQQDQIWIFGNRAGLDFRSGSPVALKSWLDAHEGCASVSRPSGSLAFYTDGGVIYNALDMITPNGALFNVAGQAAAIRSSTQGALIIPWLNDTSRYYLFSSEEYTFPYNGKLYYSVIDMRLDRGRGDVVPSMKRILMDSLMTEKMTAVRGDHCNVWIMTRSEKNGDWKAWSVDQAGVAAAPVISSVSGLPHNYLLGGIRFSPDRRRMVACSKGYTFREREGLELYDFDPATGQLSNPLILDSTAPYYQVCFSTGSTKVYAIEDRSSSQTLWQFDLSLGTPAAIAASKTRIHDVPQGMIGDIKLGPDGKLYFSGYDSSFMHEIAFPDNAGSACGLRLNAVPLIPGTSAKHGLPNVVITQPRLFPALSSNRYTCPGKNEGIAWASHPDKADYLFTYEWKDADGNILRTHTGKTGDTLHNLSEGSYQLSIRTEYGCDSAYTFRITPRAEAIAAFDLSDSVICKGLEVSFRNKSAGATSYDWQFGDGHSAASRQASHTFAQTGDYTVRLTVRNEHCTDSATAVIRVKDFNLELYPDHTGTVNRGTYVKIESRSDVPYTINRWEPQGLFPDQAAYDQLFRADTSLWVLAAGVTPYGCRDTAVVYISAEPDVLVPNAFTPNGDGRNDHFLPRHFGDPVDFRYFRIFDRWGNLVYEQYGTAPRGWDGTKDGIPSEQGTYFYVFEAQTPSGKTIRSHGDLTLIR